MTAILRQPGDLGTPLHFEYTPVAEEPQSDLTGLTEEPTLIENFSAMNNRFNGFQSLINYGKGYPGAWDETEKAEYQSGEYSWLDSLAETEYEKDEEMVTGLAEARTQREFDWIQGRIEQQREDLDRIGNMSIAESFIYGVPAVIFDPLLAPLMAMKAPAAIGRAAQIAFGAKMGLYGGVVNEATLQATQDTRGYGESAVNIAASVGFGSVAQWLFTVPARTKVARIHNNARLSIEEHQTALNNTQLKDQQYGEETAGGVGEIVASPEAVANPFLAQPSTAGAAQAYDPRLVNPSVARDLERAVDGMAKAKGWDVEKSSLELTRLLLEHSQQWTGLKNASAVKYGAYFTPSRHAATAQSPLARFMYESFVEDSWLRHRNIGDDGIASTQSLTTENQQHLNRMRGEINEIINTSYKAYAKRIPKGARLTKKEFAEEVGTAARSSKPHPDAEIDMAASAYIEKIQKPMEDLAITWNVVKTDPITGKAKGRPGEDVFVNKLYDVHQVRQGSAEFKGIIKKWYMDRERVKFDKANAKGADKDETHWSEIVTDLEDWIDNIYFNMTNVTHGNIAATVIGATRKVSESNRFKSSKMDVPVELLQKFLTKDVRVLAEQVGRSVMPQYNLMKRFYNPGDEVDIGLRNHYKAIQSQYDDIQRITTDNLETKFRQANKQSPDNFKASKKQEQQLAKALNKIEQEQKRVTKRLEYAHRASLLQNPHGYDPESALVRIGRTVRALNVFSKLGKMTVSALPDGGLTFMRNGMRLMPATVKAIKGKRMQITMSEVEANLRGENGTQVMVDTKKELRKTHLVTETAYLGRIGEISDLSHPDPGAGKFNSYLTWGLHKFGTATGMNHWNQTGKTISVHRGLLDLYDIAHTAPGSRTKKDIAELRRLGIDDATAERMKLAWDSQNIHTVDKTHVPIFSARGLSGGERLTRRGVIEARRAKRKDKYIETESKTKADKIAKKEKGIQSKLDKSIKAIGKEKKQAEQDKKLAATSQVKRRDAQKRITQATSDLAAARKQHGVEMDKLNKDAAVIMESARKEFGKKFDAELAEKGEYRPSDYDLIWDFDLQNSLKNAMTRVSNESIITPGLGDLPPWMKGPVGAMVGQFLSFPMAVMGKAVGPALQRGDILGRTVAGASMTIPLAMLSQYFKYLAANQYDFTKADFEEYMSDPAKWTENMIFHTGLLGIHTELLDGVDSLSGGRLARAAGLRDDLMTRFEQESDTYARMGAMVGYYQDAVSVTMGLVELALGEGFSKKRQRDARYMMPFQNHPAGQPVYDYIQEVLSE